MIRSDIRLLPIDPVRILENLSRYTDHNRRHRIQEIPWLIKYDFFTHKIIFSLRTESLIFLQSTDKAVKGLLSFRCAFVHACVLQNMQEYLANLFFQDLIDV